MAYAACLLPGSCALAFSVLLLFMLLHTTGRTGACFALQIRQLFAFCGSVIGCDFVGGDNQFLLVEYATAKVWRPLEDSWSVPSDAVCAVLLSRLPRVWHPAPVLMRGRLGMRRRPQRRPPSTAPTWWTGPSLWSRRRLPRSQRRRALPTRMRPSRPTRHALPRHSAASSVLHTAPLEGSVCSPGGSCAGPSAAGPVAHACCTSRHLDRG